MESFVLSPRSLPRTSQVAVNAAYKSSQSNKTNNVVNKNTRATDICAHTRQKCTSGVETERGQSASWLKTAPAPQKR